ncbi:MAG: hypothetical protein Q8O24_10360, partial [Gallionellaceae bacterium]|nr:hypothetical protein [Gallionellaceae bacterium]
GKNRQVRRMTAKAGFPTLRLIRFSIGDWNLDGLLPGEWREIPIEAHTPDRQSKPQNMYRPSTRGGTGRC